MKKRLLSILLVFAAALSLCACGAKTEQVQPAEETAALSEASAEAETAKEITVTDLIGREVTIVPGSYQRVVCIGAGALRMYSIIGDVTLLCGVEDIDNLTLEQRPKMFDGVARPYVLAYGDIFAALPSCGVGGPQAQTAEAEKILSCSPDIVISEYEDVEKEDALQAQLGVPVITLRSGPAGVFADEFRDSMKLLGEVFSRENRANDIVTFVDAQRDEISSRTANVNDEDKPSVYICGLGNWGTTNHLMTAPNYVNFNVANINNVLTEMENTGVQAIEEEKFTAIGENMDIMIIDAAAVKNIKTLYAEDPSMFDTCKAWREGEVYLEMSFNAYYTNYELALMNTWFAAKTVYPELFEDVDMAEVSGTVCEAFYGKDLSEAIFSCTESFGGYQKIDTAEFFN